MEKKNNEMKIKIKKLREDAILPAKKTDGAIGYDLAVPYRLCKGYSLMLGGYSNTLTTFATVDKSDIRTKR